MAPICRALNLSPDRSPWDEDWALATAEAEAGWSPRGADEDGEGADPPAGRGPRDRPPRDRPRGGQPP